MHPEWGDTFVADQQFNPTRLETLGVARIIGVKSRCPIERAICEPTATMRRELVSEPRFSSGPPA